MTIHRAAVIQQFDGGLYHPGMPVKTWMVLLSLLASCSQTPTPQSQIDIQVTADGKTFEVQVLPGSTVMQALEVAGIELGEQDLVEPPATTVLLEATLVRVKRMTEEFTVEQEIIPFERQVLQTESLPAQEMLLAQRGENGIQEITYRHVIEDGVEVSRNAVKWVVVKEAIAEITMVGIQQPFTPLTIPGRLAYLLAGNAWLMEGTTANRRPITNYGDLDGRIFSLSPDGNWLLFTRQANDPDQINSLWAAQLEGETARIVDLKVDNVVHYADWVPNSTSLKVSFSTVEPRSTAPGWQANNDLNILTFSGSGWVSKWDTYLEANSGGVYGWWGTGFTWDPYGEWLAYVRPDQIGLLDFENASLSPIMDILPLQTHSDWAWVPGLTWSPDSKALYTVDHISTSGVTSAEESPWFDLIAISFAGAAPVNLVSQVGMFAYPTCSPLKTQPNGEKSYQVAFLQAIFPAQSDTSRYRLTLMDRDGSNRTVVFPTEGKPGLEPQRVVWSPVPQEEQERLAIAVIYQGNIWLVMPDTLEAIQVTGDGLASRLAWR